MSRTTIQSAERSADPFFGLRRPHRQVNELGGFYSSCEVRCEVQSAGALVPHDQLGQAGLENGHLSLIKPFNLGLVDIDASNLISTF